MPNTLVVVVEAVAEGAVMAAKTFRGTNRQGRHEGFVVRDINQWLEELGEDFLISSIRVIHQEGSHDETLVWVNTIRFTEE